MPVSSKFLTHQEILQQLKLSFSDLNIINTWGETSIFLNPESRLKRGVYFCTIKEKDGPNDKASNLNREGVFRFNLGLSQKTFLALFASIPKKPSKGMIIEEKYDFKECDILTPHPVYGWMSWCSILNPSLSSWKNLEGFLWESYSICLEKHQLRIKKSSKKI